MQFSIATFFSAALLSGAFFLSGVTQTITIVALMLLAPLFDKKWRPGNFFNANYFFVYVLLAICCLILVSVYDIERVMIINQLMFVAIPEEIFFRAYLMRILGMNLKANMVVSILFSLLHSLTRGWLIGVAVFIPSLVFGAIYQKYKDVLLIVLVHFLSNLFFFSVLMGLF